jgi:hypothetical protein
VPIRQYRPLVIKCDVVDVEARFVLFLSSIRKPS